jgi:hypothetical protein
MGRQRSHKPDFAPWAETDQPCGGQAKSAAGSCRVSRRVANDDSNQRLNDHIGMAASWSARSSAGAVTKVGNGFDLSRTIGVQGMTVIGVRREKAALSSGCKPHLAIRSRRKQSEQSWR